MNCPFPETSELYQMIFDRLKEKYMDCQFSTDQYEKARRKLLLEMHEAIAKTVRTNMAMKELERQLMSGEISAIEYAQKVIDLGKNL